MSDSISIPNSPYINENQCINIAHFEPPRKNLQPNICNQRKIINNPLEIVNKNSMCRRNTSTEHISFQFSIIVPRDVDLHKETHNSYPITNITTTRKEIDVSLNIGSNIMISTNNTIISINLRKKLRNDKLLHSNINSINTNSHNTIIKYINTKPFVNQQQHVHQQIDQNQPLFIKIAKRLARRFIHRYHPIIFDLIIRNKKNSPQLSNISVTIQFLL